MKLLCLLSLFLSAFTQAREPQTFPPNDHYAIILDDALLKTHIWLQASDDVFDSKKIDSQHVQKFRDWLKEANTTLKNKPNSLEERKQWVDKIRILYLRHLTLLNATPKPLKSFQISVRGLVLKPQTLTISQGTSINQALQQAGGLRPHGDKNLLCFYRNGEGFMLRRNHPLSKSIKLRPGDMLVYLDRFLLECDCDPFEEHEKGCRTSTSAKSIIPHYHTLNQEKEITKPLLNIVEQLPGYTKLPSEKVSQALERIATALKNKQMPRLPANNQELGFDFAIQAADLLYADPEHRSLATACLHPVVENPKTTQQQLRYILNLITRSKDYPYQKRALDIYQKRFPDHWSIPIYDYLRRSEVGY